MPHCAATQQIRRGHDWNAALKDPATGRPKRRLFASVDHFRHCRLGQHHLQQPREAGFQIPPAQAVLVQGALGTSVDQAGIAQDAEVVGHAGFWPARVQFAAGRGFNPRQVAHDLQACRVAQRMQQALQGEFCNRRMFECTHGRNDTSLPRLFVVR